MRRLAGRRAQASVDDGRGAVGAIEGEAHAPRAPASEGQPLAKLFRKMIETGDDALMGDERFGEGKPCRIIRRGKKGGARFLAAPKRLIEAMKHGFGRFTRMEPPLERCTRQIVELADALQAESPQQPCDVAVKAQGLHGKRRQGLGDLSLRDDDGRGGRVARQRMSASQGLGEGKPRGEAEASEAPRHAVEERAVAAEEMRHA